MAILKHREDISLQNNALLRIFYVLLFLIPLSDALALHPLSSKRSTTRSVIRPTEQAHQEIRLLSGVPFQKSQPLNFDFRFQTQTPITFTAEVIRNATTSFTLGVQKKYTLSSGFSLIPILQYTAHQGSEIRAGSQFEFKTNAIWSGQASLIGHSFFESTFYKNESTLNHFLGAKWIDLISDTTLIGGAHFLQDRTSVTPTYSVEIEKKLQNPDHQFLVSAYRNTNWTVGIGFRWKMNSEKIRTKSLKNDAEPIPTTAQVLAYQDRLFWIHINKGENDGIRKSQEFGIYSKSTELTPPEQIAKATAFEIKDHEAILKVTEFFIPKTIEEGFEARPILR